MKLLPSFFESGWQDPAKIHHGSARLNLLVSQAKEEIAGHLDVAPDEIEFVGELGFAMFSGFAGLLHGLSATVVYSTIDRQLIHAFARDHRARGGSAIEIGFGTRNVDLPTSQRPYLFSWQATNRETGIESPPPLQSDDDLLFADMTGALPHSRLPENWDVAVWDPRSFGGVQGLSILAISRKSRWTSPYPKMDKRRIFGTYSQPLLLATAVGMSRWIADFNARRRDIEIMNQELRAGLSASISDLVIAPGSDPRYLALGIKDVIAEELLRKLEVKGILIDAGSACGAGALSPSHVLDALGMAGLGHIRLMLKATHTQEEIAYLIRSMTDEVAALRNA